MIRITSKRLEWLGIVFAAAIAATLLLPHDNPASRRLDLVNNELCIVAPATPYDPASGMTMLDARPVPAAARCMVCGMYPARYPRWAAQVIFRDGASHYFDSPVDLFVYLRQVERYTRGYTQADVAVSYVTDFETGKWIEAKQAYFVYGSSALGPMRSADLPAFSNKETATRLVHAQGGKVLTIEQVTPALIQSMNRSIHHQH